MKDSDLLIGSNAPRDTILLRSGADEDLELALLEMENQHYQRKWYNRTFNKYIAAALLLLLLIIAVSLTVALTAAVQLPFSANDPILIFISVDGARKEYMSRGITPTFDSIAYDGIHSEFLYSQFPTQTFPNHYTLVTGLYPESHGIVSNYFYDPSFRETFFYQSNVSTTNGKWWNGEPIWVTAKKAGKVTATCFLPGSEALISGYQPDIWLPYEEASRLNNTNRVDLVLSWLDKKTEARPHFVGLYFSSVDSAGHTFGPTSNEVNKALMDVDVSLHRLLSGIQQRHLDDKVNIIITSDHGMTAVNMTHPIRLYELDVLNSTRVLKFDNTPVVHVFPLKLEETKSIYADLKQASLGQPWKVYLKEEFPKELHYQLSNRIPPLLLVADQPYVFLTEPYVWKTKGMHGYDGKNEDMQAIFYAMGPAFKSSKAKPIDPIQNVEIYNIMTNILRIDGSPNNGTLPVHTSIRPYLT